MKTGSLFAGIGGLDLALEPLGIEPAWFVEIEPEPSAVLKEQWPGVPNYGDITKVDWHGVEPVEVLTGGFPCQVISLAGRGGGIAEGTRSGLWSEYARAISVLRPSYVFIENVSALVVRGLDRVLRDLAEFGFDAEWSNFPASAVGTPHKRNRIYIVAQLADTNNPRWHERPGASGPTRRTKPQNSRVFAPNPSSQRRREESRSTSSDESSDAGRITQDDYQSCGSGSQQFGEYACAC